jgi:hypothetical protein
MLQRVRDSAGACNVPLQPAQLINKQPILISNGSRVQHGCSRKMRKHGKKGYSGSVIPPESKGCGDRCKHKVVGSHREQGRWGIWVTQGVAAPQGSQESGEGGKSGERAPAGKTGKWGRQEMREFVGGLGSEEVGNGN